jgi:hypothetical protein
MTDSPNENLSDFDKLATDILIDFSKGSRKPNNYLDRRLALISNVVGGAGLSTVDERLAEKLQSTVEANQDLEDEPRQEILAWSESTLLHHASSH